MDSETVVSQVGPPLAGGVYAQNRFRPGSLGVASNPLAGHPGRSWAAMVRLCPGHCGDQSICKRTPLQTGGRHKFHPDFANSVDRSLIWMQVTQGQCWTPISGNIPLPLRRPPTHQGTQNSNVHVEVGGLGDSTLSDALFLRSGRHHHPVPPPSSRFIL